MLVLSGARKLTNLLYGRKKKGVCVVVVVVVVGLYWYIHVVAL